MRPILFSIGPISFSSFGFFAALAFLLACFLIWKFSQEELLFSKTPVKEETLFDALFVFALAAFFGARLIYIFTHFDQFGFNLLRWILIREVGGLSFLGGFLVGTLALFFFSFKKRIEAWDIADLFSLGLSGALSLGFVGAFLDGVGAGGETDLPWGILFVGYKERRHPVQLLAAILFLFIFLILKRVRFLVLKKKGEKGAVFLCFLALSSLTLFLLDFLKEGEIYLKYFKRDQLLYLGASLIGGAWFYKRLERNFKSDVFVLFQYLKSLKKEKEVGGKP